MPKESNLQSKIIKDLESMKSPSFPIESCKIMKANKNGFPDIFFISIKTGTCFVETKREKYGIASVIQKKRLSYLSKCGAKCFICDSWEIWKKIKKEVF